MSDNEWLRFVVQPVRRLNLNALDIIARTIISVFFVEVVVGFLSLIGYQSHVPVRGWDDFNWDVQRAIPWTRSFDSTVVFLLLPITLFLLSSALFPSENRTNGFDKPSNLNLVFVAIGIYFLGVAAYLVDLFGSLITNYDNPWFSAGGVIEILAQITIGFVLLTICLQSRKVFLVRRQADVVEDIL